MGPNNQFPTTQWSLILSIQNKPSGELDRLGVEKFCRDYWPPVTSFLRSLGLQHEDAEDLAQEVFSQLHSGERFSDIAPAKGRMRSFLMTLAKRQAIGFHRKQQAQKRGGESIHVSLEREVLEYPDSQSPERAFDRSWALQLIELTPKIALGDSPEAIGCWTGPSGRSLRRIEAPMRFQWMACPQRVTSMTRVV
jgi:hypothetical protein